MVRETSMFGQAEMAGRKTIVTVMGTQPACGLSPSILLPTTAKPPATTSRVLRHWPARSVTERAH